MSSKIKMVGKGKAPEKPQDIEEGSGSIRRNPFQMPNLPKPLTLEEKRYLLAVERGELANVRRMLQKAHKFHHINVNCMDPLGRGALLMAIDNENLEMVELLIVMEVETNDALLHAIDKEFVEAVEILLEHEELIHKENEPYSWERIDRNIATFTPEITPLILAAHRNNYEILKILLDRGATVPMPHDIRCGCEDCIKSVQQDSLRHSMARINSYRALSSPSLIALTSADPILTAFELSAELKNLAYSEHEFQADYMELRRQCQSFAVDLLGHTRTSTELAVLLNHDPEAPPYEDGDHMKLARLELAVDYKQKKFVAHPNIQQLLAAIWYDGLPGFRRKTHVQKSLEILKIAVLFPYYCALYMIAPESVTGRLMRKPFMKFLIHASSYLFFLFLLILVSQRFEITVIQLFGTEAMKMELEQQLLRQRGNGPTILECIVAIYVIGFLWEEAAEIVSIGYKSYMRNMWNVIDITRNSLYFMVILLRCVAYFQQQSEIAANPQTAFIPREDWNAFDPQLIAEGLFAAANVFSALKLVHMFSINPYLGPLQISLGRMIIDIIKFFFIYSLVLFAFACGLNQLLWYYSEMERQKCYTLPGGLPDWGKNGESCMKWRHFANLFESSQSLFWASFGMIGLDEFELTGIKEYTRFWGMLMFGSYSVINVIVLLNLLIAMMSNSYAMITEHADTEWKFARTRLWMSYFEEGGTLPSPFNLFPTPKSCCVMFRLRKKDKQRRMSKKEESEVKERDHRYTAVMMSLVWRYVSGLQRHAEEREVTEDDINEVKGEISSLRFELLEIFEDNNMDISSADKKSKACLGRKMRIWERRLMKDFHVAAVAGEDDSEALENEQPGDKFRRLARLAIKQTNAHKWRQAVRGVKHISQIGRSMSSDSFASRQNLQKAMEEARKMVAEELTPGHTPRASPLPEPISTGATILDLLRKIKEEEDDEGDNDLGPQTSWKPPGKDSGTDMNLKVLSSQTQTSRPVTPRHVEEKTTSSSNVPMLAKKTMEKRQQQQQNDFPMLPRKTLDRNQQQLQQKQEHEGPKQEQQLKQMRQAQSQQSSEVILKPTNLQSDPPPLVAIADPCARVVKRRPPAPTVHVTPETPNQTLVSSHAPGNRGSATGPDKQMREDPNQPLIPTKCFTKPQSSAKPADQATSESSTPPNCSALNKSEAPKAPGNQSQFDHRSPALSGDSQCGPKPSKASSSGESSSSADVKSKVKSFNKTAGVSQQPFVEITLPATPMPGMQNPSPEMLRHATSTEPLIPEDSQQLPLPRSVDNVSTIKRQPRNGWF